MAAQEPANKPLALTMGDPAGIGGEIALRAWQERQQALSAPFFLIDSPGRIAALAADLGWPVPVRPIAEAREAIHCFDAALPILPLDLPAACRPGRPDPANAPAILGAIQRAVELVRSGAAAAVVTNPISKEVLYAAGFRHPGHTEYLAELAGARTPAVMMLACPGLRVVPVTIHLSLTEALRRLDGAAILHAARITAEALRRDFGVARPRLAMAGLNPHAGEGGKLGREEIETLIPAAQTLRAEGVDISDPRAADSLFHAEARAGYDAAICMYHDQALIPLKTIDFARGVNITLGLPFIRTSPDHGTAFGIAGEGKASATSLIAALETAGQMAAARRAAAEAAG